MSQAFDVSVVLPMYNVRNYVAEALDSLISQTLQNIQIIFVDDGSTDGSADIVRAYQMKDPRIQLIHQENAGAALARNTGLDVAQADYVMFLDPDDVFHPELCEKLLAKARATDADLCFCGAYDFVDSVRQATSRAGSYTKLAQRIFATRQVALAGQLPKSLYQMTNPAPWNKIYRKAFLLDEGIRFQNLRNANDLFFYIAALASAKRIASVPEDLVYYRNARAGGAQLGREKHPCEFAKALTAGYEFLCETGRLTQCEHSFCRLLITHVRYNLKGPVSFGSFQQAYNAAKTLLERVFQEHPDRLQHLGEPGRALVDAMLALDAAEYLHAEWKTIPDLKEELAAAKAAAGL